MSLSGPAKHVHRAETSVILTDPGPILLNLTQERRLFLKVMLCQGTIIALVLGHSFSETEKLQFRPVKEEVMMTDLSVFTKIRKNPKNRRYQYARKRNQA